LLLETDAQRMRAKTKRLRALRLAKDAVEVDEAPLKGQIDAGDLVMSFRFDPELAVRWQRLAERQRDHLLSLRDTRRTFDDAGLEALISGAEYNIAAWTALAGRSNSGDDVGGASGVRPSDELSVPKFDPNHLPADSQGAVAVFAGECSGNDAGGASEERPGDELSVPAETDETPKNGLGEGDKTEASERDKTEAKPRERPLPPIIRYPWPETEPPSRFQQLTAWVRNR
jgi:hypothetical protein